MRTLQLTDVFAAVRLLGEIEMREEVKEIALRADEVKTKSEKTTLGIDLIFGVIEKATTKSAENKIYEFLANIFECAPDEVRTMDPIDLMDKLEEVADFEKWKRFFGHVAKLITKK